MNVELIYNFFSSLTSHQKEQFGMLPELYLDWNSKINVISRKDIDNLVCNHILHSLAIARFISFKPGTTVLDVGTGGGFPGIPLAIMFPEVNFTLIDSIGKKLKVVDDIIEKTGLKNTRTIHTRAEDLKDKYQFIVTRGALSMDILWGLAQKLIDRKEQRNGLPNGVIALKGGNLDAELRRFKNISTQEDIAQYFDLPFFESKKVVYLPL
ncbi:MAG: 16S rRNA (guanine(527)-N(7))-methyltransferase RsmG [Porphyromonas sp.]|nr:16S rRNA (guanine(527)-N(7))-methyltransferase RsmG [Porphyromonas sp.]